MKLKRKKKSEWERAKERKAAKATLDALADLCFVPMCSEKGTTKHECVTCEELGRKHVFTIHCCPLHRDDGLNEVKKHALIAHPSNIVRVVAAGLAGEEI